VEWSILFLGPAGAGKTQAIRLMSDIEVVATEAKATDEVALYKSHTTVAMDMGIMQLGEGDRILLYGAPGQDRFDFMWDILLQQSKGVVLLIDHSRSDPAADLSHYLDQLDRCGGKRRPMVVGVTHTDVASDSSIDLYREQIKNRSGLYDMGGLPILTIDARNPQNVRTLLLALTAMMDMSERFPSGVDV
jgi:signal recognition particle receptor subunit beta